MARLYISDSQTWLKWASLVLAVYVASENPEYIHATTHPKALDELRYILMMEPYFKET